MKGTLNYWRIKFSPNGMNIGELMNTAMGIRVTGDHDVTVVTWTDQQLQDKVGLVSADIGLRRTSPAKTLTQQEQLHVDDLGRALIADSYNVEKAANKVAAGNRAIFDQIVYRTGYASRAVYNRSPRIFELDVSVAGSIHIILPSEGQGSYTYYFKFGPTSAINMLSTAFEPTVCLPVADLIVAGFKDFTIMAVQYGVLIHPKHTKAGRQRKAASACGSRGQRNSYHTHCEQRRQNSSHLPAALHTLEPGEILHGNGHRIGWQYKIIIISYLQLFPTIYISCKG